MIYNYLTLDINPYDCILIQRIKVMKLKLKRRLSYHLLRTYLPSIFFVTIAWCSMFVPLNHVPGNFRVINRRGKDTYRSVIYRLSLQLIHIVLFQPISSRPSDDGYDNAINLIIKLCLSCYRHSTNILHNQIRYLDGYLHCVCFPYNG